MPCITRAQTMDVLPRKGKFAAAIVLSLMRRQSGGALPMMTTAAGTVAPNFATVLGAAGLHAIRDRRRLGAIVMLTDVRPAAKVVGSSFCSARSLSPWKERRSPLQAVDGRRLTLSRCSRPRYQVKQAAPSPIISSRRSSPRPPHPGRLGPAPRHGGDDPGDAAGFDLRSTSRSSAAATSRARVAGSTTTTPNGVRIIGHLNVPGLHSATSVFLALQSREVSFQSFVETLVETKADSTVKPKLGR